MSEEVKQRVAFCISCSKPCTIVGELPEELFSSDGVTVAVCTNSACIRDGLLTLKFDVKDIINPEGAANG